MASDKIRWKKGATGDWISDDGTWRLRLISGATPVMWWLYQRAAGSYGASRYTPTGRYDDAVNFTSAKEGMKFVEEIEKGKTAGRIAPTRVRNRKIYTSDFEHEPGLLNELIDYGYRSFDLEEGPYFHDPDIWMVPREDTHGTYRMDANDVRRANIHVHYRIKELFELSRKDLEGDWREEERLEKELVDPEPNEPKIRKNRFSGIAERVAEDDLYFELSQIMWKTKDAINKATKQALASNNDEAMEMLERAQKPFYGLIQMAGWQFTRYSDPWKNLSESQAVRLLNTAKDTLQIVKKIVRTYGLT